MNPTRSGSVLLLVFAIVISLTVVAYAFIRVAQMHNETSDSMNRQALAVEAARMGTQHAIEQIMRDYLVPTTSPAYPPGFTIMDGQARSPFLSMNVANNGWVWNGWPLTYYEGGDTEITSNGVGLYDGQTERLTYMPMYSWYWRGYSGTPFAGGDINYDGRGRFYEPNFYNLSATSASATVPTVAVPFGNPSATQPIPTRDNAIFYDQYWRRIATGNHAADRVNARYRLRYCIGVADLDGAICVNGDPEWMDNEKLPTTQGGHQLLSTAPSLSPQTPFPNPPVPGVGVNTTNAAQTSRIERYENVLSNLMWAHNRYGTTYFANCPRIEHVFQGRGMAGNFDQNGQNNAPLTFPLMYRQINQPQLFRDGQPGYCNVVNDPIAQNLYATNSGSPSVTGLPQGGETVPPSVANYDIGGNMRRSLVGAQYSFDNVDLAVPGGQGEGTENKDAQLICANAFTPFGRGLSATTAVGSPPSNFSHFVGPNDSPFLINVMTAPMEVIHAAIAAYMPPEAIGAFYNDISNPTPTQAGYLQLTLSNALPSPLPANYADPYVWGVKTSTGAIVSLPPALAPMPPELPNDPRYFYNNPTSNPAAIPPIVPYANYWGALSGQRDMFVNQMSLAFSSYSAPSRGSPAISPDYHIASLHHGDPAYRSPAARYPGPVCVNGYDDTDTWQNDTLGMYLMSTNANLNGQLAPWGGPATGASPAPYPSKIFAGYMSGLGCGPGVNGLAGIPPWDPHTGYAYFNGQASRSAFWYAPFNGWSPQCGGSEIECPTAWQGGANNWALGYGMTLSNGTVGGPGNANASSTAASMPPGGPVKQWGNAYFMPHPNSIWNAVGNAMGMAVMMSRAGWVQYQTHYVNPQAILQNSVTPWVTGPWVGTRTMTIADVDALFLQYLGINISNPTGPPPTVCYPGGNWPPHMSLNLWNNYAGTVLTPAWNLASLRSQPWFATPTFTAAQRTAVMELIINDMRMSFFGCNPQYTTFQPLDLDGDGSVKCSCYPGGSAGPGTPPTYYFANSAVFEVAKSHFWEITSRGELWDNVLQNTISESTQDTVICVDPFDSANEYGPLANQHPDIGQYSTHIMYQRSFYDKYRGHLSRKY